MTVIQIQELALAPDALALFSRLRHLTGSFLFYSGSGIAGEQFDIFSALPSQWKTLTGTVSKVALDVLSKSMISTLEQHRATASDLPTPGWFGSIAYNLVAHFPAPNTHSSPGFFAGFYPVIFVIDRVTEKVFCLSLDDANVLAQQLIALLTDMVEPAATSAFALTGRFNSNLSPAAYEECFDRVQHYLHAGDCYQVNLAQRFTAPYRGDPWQAYLHLTRSQPAPMGCYFSAPNLVCLSVSPERFLSVQRGIITTHPIKGTRPRVTEDPERDRAQLVSLRESEKDRAENLMIVDLLRNDLGLSCVPGSIRVSRLFDIRSFANVHHMVSDIEGALRPEVHPLQALIAAFPGGSITGAPKKRAMEIIAELEPDARSFYCGSAFYCDVTGRMDSNILIRTLLCQDDQIHCWGGGGIVADSTANAEYQETLDKVGHILRALETLSGLSSS